MMLVLLDTVTGEHYGPFPSLESAEIFADEHNMRQYDVYPLNQP